MSLNSWTWLITVIESTILKFRNYLIMNFSIPTFSTLYFLYIAFHSTFHSWLNYTHHIVYCLIHSRCSFYTKSIWFHASTTTIIVRSYSFSDNCGIISIKNFVEFKVVKWNSIFYCHLLKFNPLNFFRFLTMHYRKCWWNLHYQSSTC